MTKIIKKTAIITALSLVAVSLLSVFALFVFAPKKAGDICNELGLKKVALSCYEKNYNSTGDFDDLMLLVDNSIFEEDNERIVNYGKIAFSRKVDFDSLCTSLDGDGSVDYPTYDYYSTAIVNAYYNLGKNTDLVKFAFKNLSKDGYTETSALYYTVQLAKSDNSLRDVLGDEYYSKNNWTFTGRTLFKNDLSDMGYTQK